MATALNLNFDPNTYNLKKYNAELHKILSDQLEALKIKKAGIVKEVQKPNAFKRAWSRAGWLAELSPWKGQVALYDFYQAYKNAQITINDAMEKLDLAIQEAAKDLPELIEKTAKTYDNSVAELEKVKNSHNLKGFWVKNTEAKIHNSFKALTAGQIHTRYYQAVSISLQQSYVASVEDSQNLSNAQACEKAIGLINRLISGFTKVLRASGRHLPTETENKIQEITQASGVVITELKDKQIELTARRQSKPEPSVIILPTMALPPMAVKQGSVSSESKNEVNKKVIFSANWRSLENFFTKKTKSQPVKPATVKSPTVKSPIVKLKFPRNTGVNYVMEQAHQAMSPDYPLTNDQESMAKCAFDLADAFSEKKNLNADADSLRKQIEQSNVFADTRNKALKHLTLQLTNIQKKYREIKEAHATGKNPNKADLSLIEQKMQVSLEVACRLGGTTSEQVKDEKIDKKSGKLESQYGKLVSLQINLSTVIQENGEKIEAAQRKLDNPISKVEEIAAKKELKIAEATLAKNQERLDKLGKNYIFIACNLDAQIQSLKKKLSNGNTPNLADQQADERSELPASCFVQ